MAPLMVGLALHEDGNLEEAAAIYSEALHHELLPAQEAHACTLRADAHDRLGRLQAAIADYARAAELKADDGTIQYRLCWDYAITGQAQLALPHCERAVELEPSPANLDGCGIAYALLDRRDDAIADLRTVVDTLSTTSDPELVAIRVRRQAWLEALEEGGQRITPAVLAVLRAETCAACSPDGSPTPTPRPVTAVAIQEAAESKGFAFGETMPAPGQATDGLYSVIGRVTGGQCEVRISPETAYGELSTATLLLTGCEQNFESGYALWFMGELLGTSIERALATAWLATDIYTIIAGQRLSATKVIGDVTFSATKRSAPSRR